MQNKIWVTNCLNKINELEALTGRMFHETHPDLEASFIRGCDTKTHHNLMFVYNTLCKLIDEAKSQPGDES